MDRGPASQGRGCCAGWSFRGRRWEACAHEGPGHRGQAEPTPLSARVQEGEGSGCRTLDLVPATHPQELKLPLHLEAENDLQCSAAYKGLVCPSHYLTEMGHEMPANCYKISQERGREGGACQTSMWGVELADSSVMGPLPAPWVPNCQDHLLR